MNLFKTNYLNTDILQDIIYNNVISYLTENTIEILNSKFYIEYLDEISSLSESTIALLNDPDLLLLYEAIGEPGIRRIGDMVLNHRTRDEDTFKSGKADKVFKPASAYHIFKKSKDKADIRNSVAVNNYKLQKKVDSIVNKHGKSTKGLIDYVDKRHNEIKENKRSSDQQYKKLDKKLGSKYNVSTTDTAGSVIEGDYALTSKDNSHNDPRSNVYGMYHAKKNNSRENATQRLISYIDKKDYTDDDYIKKNSKNISRADDAKEKMIDKYGDDAVSGEYHKHYSKKEVNNAFGVPYTSSK